MSNYVCSPGPTLLQLMFCPTWRPLPIGTDLFCGPQIVQNLFKNKMLLNYGVIFIIISDQ